MEPTSVHTPDKRRRWIALPADLYGQLKARSAAEGRTFVSVIRRMLAETEPRP